MSSWETQYLFVLSLRVLPSEFVALHLPEMHDKTHKQIIIWNDDYKFATYPHSILQLKCSDGYDLQ